MVARRILTFLFLVGMLVFYYFLKAGELKKTGDAESGRKLEPEAELAAPFKVALLLTGPISDDGWNASAYEGLQRAAAELGVQTSYLENLEKSRFEEMFRSFASEGCDLIIGHAYEFQDAALRVAPGFPQADFVVIAGNRAQENVSSVSFRLEEASFVLGALAASMSTTGKLGLVGGEEIPSLEPGFVGFANGARHVRPDVRVITKYVGNWVDVALGKEYATALIEQGVDFIFQNADKAGLGVFQAVQQHEGCYAFGSNRDQNEIAPDAILASAVIDVPETIVRLCAAVREERFAPGTYGLGVREGIVRVVMNPALDSVVPDSTHTLITSIQETIGAGDFDVLAPDAPRARGGGEPFPAWLQR